MEKSCEYFNLSRYSDAPEDWSEWAWPTKIWQKICDEPVSELFDKPELVHEIESQSSVEGAVKDYTPQEIVDSGETSAKTIISCWSRTTDSLPASCDREPESGDTVCELHSPPSESSDNSILNLLQTGKRQTVVGGNFGKIDLSNTEISADDTQTLKLDFCHIDHLNLSRSDILLNVDIRYATLGQLSIDRAHFDKEFDMSHTEVYKGISGEHVRFAGRLYGISSKIYAPQGINFREANFHGYTCFDRAEFFDTVDIWNAVCHADIEFRFCTFHKGVNSRWVDYHRFPDFYGSRFSEVANFGGATFNDDAGFSNITVTSQMNFQTSYGSFDEYSAVFHGVADFTDSEFKSGLNLREAEFKKYTSFQSADVIGHLSLWNAEFDEDVDFSDAHVSGTVDSRWAKFHGYVDFNEIVLADDINFGGARFFDDAGFGNAEFQGELSFRGEFGGYDGYKTTCEGIVDFGGAKFGDTTEFRVEFNDDVSFVEATFEARAAFTAKFGGETNFADVVFRGETDFSDSEFTSSARFQRVESDQTINMNSVRFTRGIISQPEDGATYYDFTESVVGQVQLKPVDTTDLFDHFKFYETTFEDFDFPYHGDALLGNWDIHVFNGGDPNHSVSGLINTYLKAKNGANDVGAQTASSEFFMKEMRFRRASHIERATNAGFKSMLSGTGRWLSNWFLNLSCGYGERPIRTITASLVLIVLFAAIYPLAGLSSDGSILTYFLFSTQAFVTLILGEPAGATSNVLQLVAVLQGFFGAFFIALFVFALTRSIHR